MLWLVGPIAIDVMVVGVHDLRSVKVDIIGFDPQSVSILWLFALVNIDNLFVRLGQCRWYGVDVMMFPPNQCRYCGSGSCVVRVDAIVFTLTQSGPISWFLSVVNVHVSWENTDL